MPIALEMCEGLTTCLGIESDTQALELCLPVGKLNRVQMTVREWLGRKVARKKDFESLLDLPQHTAKVVKSGRWFVRRLIQVMLAAKSRVRSEQLGLDVRSDLT